MVRTHESSNDPGVTNPKTHLLPDVEPHHAGLRTGLEDCAEDGQDGRGDEGPLPPELIPEDAEQNLACGWMWCGDVDLSVNDGQGPRTSINTN